jgi:hypothetical protein
MDAVNNPVKRQYQRKEVSTADMDIGQRPNVDLEDLVNFIRGESIVDNVGEKPLLPEYADALAFMEEPVTIRIEENSRSDFPETHVPVAVNGKEAEVLQNGQWLAIGWLPVGVPLTTKRKYVEVLARAKPDAIRTVHDDANVERPRNTVQRRTSSSYPLSVIRDDNPRGHEWLSRIMMGH